MAVPSAVDRPIALCRATRHAGRSAIAATRGDRRIWAAGIVYAIGRVNFLADPSQLPHLRTDDLADRLGVKQTTTAGKGRLIMDRLRIGLMDPEYARRDMGRQEPVELVRPCPAPWLRGRPR